MNQSVRLTAPPGKALPRCTTCGERTRKHDGDLCEVVGELKERIKASKPTVVLQAHVQPAPAPSNQEPSVSQADPRGFRPAANQFTPITTANRNPDEPTPRDRGIYLPVSSRPNLATRYQPILEMRLLLELRGLQLSHFHINERGGWAFMVSGSKGQIVDWAAETKASSAIKMGPSQNRHLSHMDPPTP